MTFFERDSSHPQSSVDAYSLLQELFFPPSIILSLLLLSRSQNNGCRGFLTLPELLLLFCLMPQTLLPSFPRTGIAPQAIQHARPSPVTAARERTFSSFLASADFHFLSFQHYSQCFGVVTPPDTERTTSTPCHSHKTLWNSCSSRHDPVPCK